MKITVQTAAFARELFKANGVSSSKSTMPILQNIILEATEDQRVRIQITDLEISLTTELSGDDVQVHQPGRVAIRIRELHDTVKQLRNPELTLEKDDQDWVNLQSGTVKARFVGTNPDEYPAIATGDDLNFFEVPTDRFTRMISSVLFSVSKDSARPHLGGGYLHTPEAGKMGMVSTDGHRLSVANFTLEGDLPEELNDGVIVPRKGLEEFIRMADGTLAHVGIAFWQSNIVLQQDQTQLLIRLIDGSFPNYKQVIPAEREESRAVVDRALLADRIKLVSLFSNQRTRNLRLELQAGNCIISAHDPEKGECEEHLAVNYDGPDVRAGFNANYLSEVLSAIKGSDITLEITDALKPAIIHDAEPREGEESVFIVMPMRI